MKAAPAVPAYYDWSGVYVGVHAGYGGGMKDWSDQSADFVARGFLAGGQVGINKQLGSFVFGVELDGSWANIKGSQAISVGGPVLGFQENLLATSKIDSLVTFAGRAGLAADAQSFTGTGVLVANIPGIAVGSVDFARQFGKMSQDLHLFKFGVNYHFNPAPVVVSARY